MLTNLVYSVAFLSMFYLLPVSDAILIVLAFLSYINAFMAVFNLIPFGILDGYKVFSLNKKIWAAVFIPSLILTVFTYWLFFW